MPDINAAVTEGALKAVASMTADFVAYLATLGKSGVAKLGVDLEIGFSDYLSRNYRRHSKVRTLLNPGKVTSLESAFESPSLELDDDVLNEDQFLDLIEKDNFAVITGVGGSGKSFFLKHLFIRFYNEGRGKVPLLFELRAMTDGTPLLSALFSSISAVIPSFSYELFEYALRSGKFAILLDGFDELDFSIRADVADQITQLSYAYGDNYLILTSRPDETFQGWAEFDVLKMAGLSKQQVISLVKKVRYDRDVKKHFFDLIKTKGLYESHQSYLSNPLLCSIMLLTFDQGAEIPTKMHLFFGQTFDVLFYRHDATKGTGFRRKFQTSLSIDEFRAVFSAFSAFSYTEFGPSIKRSDALVAAKNAMDYHRLDQRADDFLTDLCSSLSLLIKEGDIYSYIHRTFQEYFFAVFLAVQEIDGWGNVVETLLREKPNDSVVQLLMDINRDRFDREFLSPRIDGLCSDLQLIDVDRNPGEAFKLFYLGFSASPEDGNIFAWTVGRGGIRPKWYYLTRFVEGPRTASSVNGFDWADHLRGWGAAERDGEIELEDVSDESLLGTPMVTFLREIQSSALRMQKELRRNATTQRKLLASTLFKKAPAKGAA